MSRISQFTSPSRMISIRTEPDHSLLPLMEAAEIIYQFMESRFKRVMPQPVITVQTRGRRQAAAWFWADKWQAAESQTVPEINLCAESVGQGLLELANSVAHEMVHYVNWLDQIPDCSRSQYHNRKFKQRCEQVGLICLRHPQRRYGWGLTHLSPELIAAVNRLGIEESIFQLARIASPPSEGSGSKLKKWSCGCTNVRAAVVLDAVCNRCGLTFRQW